MEEGDNGRKEDEMEEDTKKRGKGNEGPKKLSKRESDDRNKEKINRNVQER
jgi:hypothetical protein